MDIQAVRLTRRWKFLTVDVETTNGFIEVIRERDCGTTPISHICELAGLQKANRDACEQQSMADFLASGGTRASFTGGQTMSQKATEKECGCEVLCSKVTQIQAVMHPGDFNCGPHTQLFALCEDGTIWIKYESSGSSNVPTDGKWHSVRV